MKGAPRDWSHARRLDVLSIVVAALALAGIAGVHLLNEHFFKQADDARALRFEAEGLALDVEVSVQRGDPTGAREALDRFRRQHPASLIESPSWDRGVTDPIIVVSLLALGSLGAAGLLTLRLKREFLRPIHQLAEAMRRVSRDKDYQLRLPPGDSGDIGQLHAGFNAMLSELKEHHERLETEMIQRAAMNQELTVAKEEAEAGSRAKSEFLATMSHEIRTPMNGVIGFTNILLNTPLTPEQKEYTETIRQSAESMMAILNDILDFSRIEAGQFVVELSRFDLMAAVTEVADLLSVKAEEKGVELAVRIAPNVPREMESDPSRFRQVLLNLVSNGLKFTERGFVSIEVALEPIPAGGHVLRFAVRDSGIGIPEGTQPRLFRKFTQADSSNTRKYGGLGLGLAISRSLVEQLGGRVGFESREGKGSTFWFTLPAGPIESNPAAGQQQPLAGMRILLAGVSSLTEGALVESLRSRGGQCDSADSLGALVEALQKPTKARPAFHCLIIDASLSGEAGPASLVESLKKSRRAMPPQIVLLTSSEQRKALSPGFDSGLPIICMTKPVRVHALLAMFIQHDSPGLPCPLPPANPRARSLAVTSTVPLKKRILVVEDNATNQRIADRMLQGMNCQVDLAANGLEAIQLLKQLPFDLVFMDCQMPELDGYQATRTIRKLQHPCRQIPIVALTANVNAGDRELCLEAGMNDYIAKPIKAADLRAALDRWCPRDARDEGAAQRSQETSY